MFEFALAGGSFLICVILTGAINRFAQQAGMLDRPNERSSHSIPTPRGGGLAIVIVLAGALAVLVGVGMPFDPLMIALSLGGLLVAAIGFADDHRHVPSGYRIVVHVLAAALAVVSLGGLTPLQINTYTIDLGWAGDVLAIFFLVWFVNLFNFMDGIDGLATAEATFVAGALFVLSYPEFSTLPSLLLMSLACASAAFLVWNWSPAKIFLGDVGSGFLGFSLGVLALSLAATGNASIWTALILAGVFVADATTTLVRRMFRGDRWYVAHCSHAYQRAARRLQSHAKVTSAATCVNVVWLLPIALISTVRPGWGWWLCLLAWLPLAAAAAALGAGRPD